MKDLFEGLKRAKSRTILSAVVIFLMSALICFSAFMAAPRRFTGGQRFEMPDSQTVKSSDSTETSESDTSSDEKKNQPSFDMSKVPKKGNSTVFIVVAVSSAVIGCALLVLINAKSSSKRKEEFATMMSKSIAVKSIKKQLALEVIAVAVVFGIIGCGTGLAVAGPVSGKIMASQASNFKDRKDSDGSGDSESEGIPGFPGGFDKDSLPEGFDASNLPEGFDKDSMPGNFDFSNMPEDFDPSNMPQGERPQMPNGGSFNRGDSEESEINADDIKNFSGNSKTAYITSSVAGAAAIILFTVSSAVGVTLPVKKKTEE